MTNILNASEKDTVAYKKNNIVVLPKYYLSKDRTFKAYSSVLGYERKLSNKYKLSLNVGLYREFKELNSSIAQGQIKRNDYILMGNGYYNLLSRKNNNELWIGVSALLIKYHKDVYSSTDNINRWSVDSGPYLEAGYAIQYFHKIYRDWSIGLCHTFHWRVLNGEIMGDFGTMNLLAVKANF